MIILLIGDDIQAIEQEIREIKQQINPLWRDFNLHRFNSQELEQAVACARTMPFGDGKRVVIVENCNFKQFGEEGLQLLESLAQLPKTTELIFTANSLDKRLKVVKYLLKQGKIKEFNLIPPWRIDLITSWLVKQAKQLNIPLSRDGCNYLAEAVGNNTIRSISELQKLGVYSNGKPLTKTQIQGLVPCTTQTSLQLATQLREGKATQVIQLLDELLARGEYPLVIVATLITQFRTWLWVKSALSKGMKQDVAIAQLCQIGNPKRLYFLRQEVSQITVKSLIVVLRELLDLEVALKSGASSKVMSSSLLRIVQLISG
jgi:DNA polymerase III subunit delta